MLHIIKICDICAFRVLGCRGFGFCNLLLRHSRLHISILPKLDEDSIIILYIEMEDISSKHLNYSRLTDPHTTGLSQTAWVMVAERTAILDASIQFYLLNVSRADGQFGGDPGA